MQMADWHTYQVLTKRAEHMRDMLRGPLASPPSSITSGGASASKTASTACRGSTHCAKLRPPCGSFRSSRCWRILGEIDLEGIHWVIVGGESGRGAGR